MTLHRRNLGFGVKRHLIRRSIRSFTMSIKALWSTPARASPAHQATDFREGSKNGRNSDSHADCGSDSVRHNEIECTSDRASFVECPLVYLS